jgi:hypothetical protein
VNHQRITDNEMTAAFAAANDSVLRWEHQRVYTGEEGEDDLIATWRAGTPELPPLDVPWLNMLRELEAKGAHLARVRVQDDPPNEYQRWLAYLATNWNIPGGEQIRVMSRRAARPLEWLSGRHIDWWLIDRKRVVVMHFDRDGHRLVNELTDDPWVVLRARLTWDLAVRFSTPAQPSGVLTTT